MHIFVIIACLYVITKYKYQAHCIIKHSNFNDFLGTNERKPLEILNQKFDSSQV